MTRRVLGIAGRLATAMVLALVVIVPIQLTVSPDASPAVAADASRFDPGNIISDAQFYNGSAMSAAEVQAFLESRVPVCDYSRAQLPCLRDYTQTTPTMAATLRCAPYAGSPSERASDIIAKVGQACSISQEALLVLLQKEQSLVDDTWPYVSQYNHATGFACPDTAPCDPQYSGFFYQVYWAAYAFQAYKANGGGPNYKAFQVNTIQWHPNAGCGASQIYIANYATAGLYNYTPYRPNAAALANLYGTGDSCSSYGNRNFWRLWSDWFGSPTTSAPFGWMDSASMSGSVLTATGWAIDPDTPAQSVDVRLVVDGAVAAAGTADINKPGLGAAVGSGAPGAGDNHGFSLSATLSVGVHRVCIVAVDGGGGPNATLLYAGPGASGDCAMVTVSGAPFGWMDSVVLAGPTLTVKGWAIDPDTAAALEVRLLIDGTVEASGTADVVRPGLAAAVSPGAGDAHGFSLSKDLSIGTHKVCVLAVNNAAGPDATLRYSGPGASANCATVTYGSASPFGWMDSATVAGGMLTAKGWAIDPDTSAPITVQLVIDGAVAATATANNPKPGLAAAVAPGAGDNHGFTLSTSLTPGVHRVCAVAVNNAAGPNTTLSYTAPTASNNCARVEHAMNPPVGWMDSATVVGSTMTVTGWSVDADAPAASVQVRLQVDGATVATGVANADKPGLGAAIATSMPGAGDAHGFTLSTAVTVGTHRVCVIALDDSGGASATLLYGGPGASQNCAMVTVSAAPFGWMDEASLAGSSLTVKGWAIDPDTTAPLQVQLSVDGSVVGTATADVNRPGLAAAVAPGAGDNHGFTMSTTLSAGTHTVCVVALNNAAGPSTTLSYAGPGAAGGCATVTVVAGAASPFGWMDSATLSGSSLTVKGWAIDPDTSSPISVQLLLNGSVVSTATASENRPGLASAVSPGSGDNHGFTMSTTLAPGVHRICVLALDNAGGASRTLSYGGPGAVNNCANVSFAVRAPIGWMDTLTLTGSALTVKGWSIDPDDPAAAVQVQLLVNGTVATVGAAHTTQPGLGAAMASEAPGAGDDHGYSMTTTLGVGSHTVCIVGVDNAGGANARLLYAGPGASDNCAIVAVSRAPFGWMDSVSLSGSTVSAKGWTIDPDTHGAIELQLLVDGVVATTGLADRTRPGLAAAVAPGAGDDHGYVLEATLTPGTHTVCAVALNNAPGPNFNLLYGGPGAVGNCATVTYQP